jgi:lysyl endopeptidase
VVTNHHCLADSRSAYHTEVWFNYQCAACGGFAVFRPTKVWGSRVLATDRTMDMTVFTVENFAAVAKFGHLELETGRPRSGEHLVIPQNPAGDPTMIAARSDESRSGACAVADPAYDGYGRDTDVSYYCDNEGGSSGSPVLSRRTGRVIALHHFGGCPNSGVRADLIHRRVGNLL